MDTVHGPIPVAGRVPAIRTHGGGVRNDIWREFGAMPSMGAPDPAIGMYDVSNTGFESALDGDPRNPQMRVFRR